MTTVLLVSARPGKSIPPVGILTKTARTFVQDGASTEFATQVLGTTLENGRLYARILSTSSRVFYDKDPTPDPSSPYVVYPSRAPENDWRFKEALDNAPIKAIEGIKVPNGDSNVESSDSERQEEIASTTKLDELFKENDIFNKKELNVDAQRFKPAKVRPADNLPTYTVKHEYVTSSFDSFDDVQSKSLKPRVPKIFKPQTKAPPQSKADTKPLATVTYHGFADFTTTVGDTVIVFSPSTSPVPMGRPATTIKGDATLRPDDGVAVLKIRPTTVMERATRTNRPYEGNQKHASNDRLLSAINRGNIQPSVTEEIEGESSTMSTEPLLLVPDVETGSLKPTGLLKVIDSTTSLDGTTTHYKNLIYGTYIGTNYAQIIHTSSNVYFFPDEATVTYGADETTMEYETTGTESDEQDTTVEALPSTTPTTNEETPLEMNELTTPMKSTTDRVFTTLKDILESARRVLGTTERVRPNIDYEFPNDIASGDPQGRSIKGGSPLNNHQSGKYKPHEFKSSNVEEKVTLATRLLPSTVYKTFTYFTTFFIPNNDETTTSIRSQEVVSSEVTFLTELIRPTSTDSSIKSTSLPGTKTSGLVDETEEEQTTKQDEEIELIFKTLYTTYTYLTTFFQENTSSVSSRQVIETNVITQTVGPNGVSAIVASLFDKDESVLISPTTISQNILPSVRNAQTSEELNKGTEPIYKVSDETTEENLTTFQEQDTTVHENIPTESITTVDDFETSDGWTIDLEPSPTPAIASQAIKEQVKTYYTTYTYFTTIFVDDETEIETRTEVFTNVVTETITPTNVQSVSQQTTQPATPKSESAENKSAVPPEILAYLEALQHQKSQEEALSVARKVQQAKDTDQTTHADETTTENNTELTTELPTILEDRSTTENLFRNFEVGAQVTPNPPTDVEVLGSMITDVVSSSSSGGGTVLDVMDKRNAVPEDQELSESNNHEVEPAPTLLLQTSYTTFTYFTTMYKGDQTNVASRLETITNVVTETLRPSLVMPVPTRTLPVTYFTTFTYWTTFYKGGDTITTSREETVSNVATPGVLPTPTVELGVIMTYTPTLNPLSENDSFTDDQESKITADNEVTPLGNAAPEKSITENTNALSKEIITSPDARDKNVVNTSPISPEPTTFYTTFTYFTTSYVGNQTILNSRLETITSVSTPDITTQQATGRAINGPVYPSIQILNTDEKTTVTPSKVSDNLKTGLISTIRSSEVHEDTTTHYTTDVYGTYVDGYYARVVKSSSRIETPPLYSSSIATPVLPTGVLSLNKGSVVDADEVTTVYFTTKQIGTLFEGTYAKVIESTSSTKIDEEKKATISPIHGHRTGLVRLIKGQIENNGATTFYQSKVIGTSIEGRYAQIIESTSSFFASPTANISPTSTLPPSQSTGIPEISPSPAVIQSSEDSTESPDHDEDQNEEDDEEDGEEGEDGQNSKKKSRLTFSTRKRTFTPVIRPFASRNRPTFNPKRKGAQAATTITRTDITPTITATLAGKSNRFASSRSRVTSPIGPYSSTLSPSGSRRFSGRRGTTATSSSIFPSSSTRARGQTRITPSSVFQSIRRGPTSIRGSSSKLATRASSSVFPGASSRYRPGIRPSSTLLRGQSTIKPTDDQENDANEFTTTTIFTDETSFTEYLEGETATTPLQTTTESSRRSTNPLLRFRRPINLNGRSGTTARPSTTTTPRRSGNLNRPSAPTVPRATNGRTNTRATPPASTRNRPSNTGLFPPRGFLGRKQESVTEEPTEEHENEDGKGIEDEQPVEEISDNDYEGSEHEDRRSNANVNRRSGKAVSSAVQIRPFGARTRRVRRQASQLRTYNSRFYRPAQSPFIKDEEKSDFLDDLTNKEDFAKIAPKPSARYNNRARSLTPSQLQQKIFNNPDQSTETTEFVNQQNKPKTRTTQSTNGNRNGSVRIKPSSISSNGRQFTLREKDAASSRSDYKRPTSRTTSRSSSKTTQSGRVRPPRVRTGTSIGSSNSRRVSSSRGTSRSTNGRNVNSRRGPTRGRGSYEDIRESPTVYPNFDGTITVTHYVPTEITIPVVNNGVTEHRNIITQQPSTEVLRPSQYSTVTAGDGNSLVVIVSEVTGTNGQGQTEVTRFLLHETSTTRISYTLSSLGGRRVSQSVIVPTTVYSVENIVSTIQPSLSGNAPLANILLSQLLLGQLGPNPLLQPQATPTTQYNTRTTSYVTTITKHQSTVIPLTFRGKEILTTLVDSSTDVVTATEFITDTVVVTPTAAISAGNINSLLLLLQQPQSQNSNPLLDPLFAPPPFTQSNTLPGEVERRNQPADSDYRHDSSEYSDEEVEEYQKPSRSYGGRGKSNDRKKASAVLNKAESSVVTLYVSGRRPGEFSTVLSTVKVGESVTASRRRRDALEEAVEVRPSVPPSLHAGPAAIAILAGSEDPIDAHAPTQSLESVVGDVGRHISTSIYT